MTLVRRLPNASFQLRWTPILVSFGNASWAQTEPGIATSAPGWLLAASIAVVVAIYIFALRRLKRIARQKEKESKATKAESNRADTDSRLSDEELERYARHIVLRELGGVGQKKLKSSRLLVVGAGGLGSPLIQYLAAAGAGTIEIVDFDKVSLSNLQRQVLYTDKDIAAPKAERAANRARLINPHVKAVSHCIRLDRSNASDLVSGCDLALDGSDNFDTRNILNQACVSKGVPMVFGAISQWEGQVSAFHSKPGSACFACLFPEAPAPGSAPPCAEAGVLGALPGVVGAIMAAEAIKLLVGAGSPLVNSMLIYDALWGESRRVEFERREGCEICGAKRV